LTIFLMICCMIRRALGLFLPLSTLACGAAPTTFTPAPDASASSDARIDGPTVDTPLVLARDVAPLEVSAPPPPRDDVLVYANTANELFRVDPRTLTVASVGRFAFPDDGQDHQMTDIAVNAEGELWGITFNAIYRIDANTARCTLVSPLQGQYNGLTFVPAGVLHPSSEVLVAVEGAGSYFVVNTRDGRAQRLGMLGAYASSGDLVSVAHTETWAIVKVRGEDHLARVDLRRGVTTLVGPTGVDDIWGLGYWRTRLYGFAEGGTFVTIDPTTGRATEVSRTGNAWWGAGVTTLAPTAPP
jgi:hypothetical protein